MPGSSCSQRLGAAPWLQVRAAAARGGAAVAALGTKVREGEPGRQGGSGSYLWAGWDGDSHSGGVGMASVIGTVTEMVRASGAAVGIENETMPK